MSSSQNVLSQPDVSALLATLPGWTLESGKLVRTWTFPGFVQAMDFVNGIAQLAEREGHHPDIDIRYSQVKLGLISHDAGGITQRDARMARTISDAVAHP